MPTKDAEPFSLWCRPRHCLLWFPNLVTEIKLCTTGQVWYAGTQLGSMGFLSKWTSGDLRKTQIKLHELCTSQIPSYLKELD